MVQPGNNNIRDDSHLNDLPTDLNTVLTDEWHEIRRRRRFMEALRRYGAAKQQHASASAGSRTHSHTREISTETPTAPPDNLIGLALSGGGIRSATFCLGAVQELCASGVLPGFDYLSTVSGGGYFSGWWSAWLSREPFFVTSDLIAPSDFLRQLFERHMQGDPLVRVVLGECREEEIKRLRGVLTGHHAGDLEVELIVECLNRVLAQGPLYKQVPQASISLHMKELIEALTASRDCWRQANPGMNAGDETWKRDATAWASCEHVLLNRMLLEEHFHGCFAELHDPRRMIFPRPEGIEPARFDPWQSPAQAAVVAGDEAEENQGRPVMGHHNALPERGADGSSNAWNDPIHHLRLFANYLTPRRGSLSGDTWRAIAVVSRNLTLTWLVLIPICVALMLIGQLYYLWHPATSSDFIREERDTAVVQRPAPGAPVPARGAPAGAGDTARAGRTPAGNGDTSLAARPPSRTDSVAARGPMSSREVLLVRAAAVAQPLLPILAWIVVIVIAWVISGQDGTALRHKVMPWVELIAVVMLILCLVWIFKKEVSSELIGEGSSGREVLGMMKWWVRPAPLIFWGAVAAMLLVVGWRTGWNTHELSEKVANREGDRKRGVQLRREVRRNQLVRIHATLLVTAVCLTVVLLVSGFGHELINYLFYSSGPQEGFAKFLKNAGGWGGLLLTVAGTIYTLIKASPTGGGERKRSDESSKTSALIFSITPTLMVILLGLLSAWWGHGVLGILVPADGATPYVMNAAHVVERSKPLHYITFLGVFLCFIFTWYEMKFMQGNLFPRPVFGWNIARRYVGHMLLAVAIVLMAQLIGRGMWSIYTGTFYGTLLANDATLLGEWSDGALRVLLMGSHPAPKIVSVVIAGVTGILLLVRLLFKRVVWIGPGGKNRFVGVWKQSREWDERTRFWLPGELLALAIAAFLIVGLLVYIIVLVQPPTTIITVQQWLWEDTTRNLTAYALFGIVFCLVYTLIEVGLGDGTNYRSLGLLAGIFITLLMLLSVSYVPWEVQKVGGLDIFSESDLKLLRIQSAFGLVTALLTWAIATGWTVDPNMLSLHAFYKARLTRAYLGASNPRRRRSQQRITEAAIGDDVSLGDLRNCRRGGPYHIINSTLNLVGGRDLATAQRSAANFVLTQRYCGSLRTGFRPTVDYMSGRMTLGTAVSISGAAASPNMGAKTPTAALAMMMTLFNVRLGYWAPTPNRDGWRSTQARLWPFFTLREFLSQTNDLSSFCYLTDGGHFDNTGLYALVERGCLCIMVLDCGADPAPCFADLGDAMRRCRIDFGAEFHMDVAPVTTAGDKVPRAPSHYTVGRITYSDAHLGQLHGRRGPFSNEEKIGYIIVVKPVLTGDETVDVRQYGLENDAFPQQSTADQWFDESQFESYRKLGVLSIRQIIGEGEEHGWRRLYDRLGALRRPAQGDGGIDSADVIRNLRQGQAPSPREMRILFETMYGQPQTGRDKK